MAGSDQTLGLGAIWAAGRAHGEEANMPRVLRRRKRLYIEGRPLTPREYWRVRLFPEHDWPEWAANQVESYLRRIGAAKTLAWWLEKRGRSQSGS